jgi:hypothetical protein
MLHGRSTPDARYRRLDRGIANSIVDGMPQIMGRIGSHRALTPRTWAASAIGPGDDDDDDEAPIGDPPDDDEGDDWDDDEDDDDEDPLQARPLHRSMVIARVTRHNVARAAPAGAAPF